MKVLFISLLRLGDLIMHLEVIKAFSKNNPNDEISILVQEEFRQIENMVPKSIRILYFPRAQLQFQIVDRSYHFRYAYEFFSDLVKDWNQNAFDKVINLTHNRLSGYLAGLLQSQVKLGLHYEGRFLGHLANSGWRMLNNEFSMATSSKESYVSILMKALEIKDRKRILIHPFSNDNKKNWPLRSFIQLANALMGLESVGSVSFIGTVQDFEACRNDLSSFSQVVVPFEKLREELQWSDGLIAVDSSVKHLALSQGQQVLEIALGSASPSKYSWSARGEVLCASVPCFPCSYSKACPHLVPICHEEILVRDVFARAKNLFGLNESLEKKYERDSELFA